MAAEGDAGDGDEWREGAREGHAHGDASPYLSADIAAHRVHGWVDGKVDGSADGIDDVDRFVADERIEQAAVARAREAWLRRRASEGSTLAGVCWDLAERGELVSVATDAGSQHRGRIDAVGEDFLSVRTMGGTVVVPYDALLTISTHGREEPARRPVRDGLGLAEVVAELAAGRPTVRARCGTAGAVVGQLCQGGRDVAAVRVGEGGRATVYVRLSSLSELSVLSG